MRTIPPAPPAPFEVTLREMAIPDNAHGLFKKRLRYYLDFFCQKYRLSEPERWTLDQFLRKLEEKRQTKAQQQEASHAIALYFELINTTSSAEELRSLLMVIFTGKMPAHSLL